MKSREDILLYIFLLLALIFLISGCTPIYISPSDDIYFHDQYNRCILIQSLHFQGDLNEKEN